MEIKNICVFCGSRMGVTPDFQRQAQSFGEQLGQRGFNLVYGGGRVGLMGEVADAVLRCGGQVYGYIPEKLFEHEVAHKGLTELHVTKDMHERKQKMSERADAFVALPGGFGTLDELCEILTWAQLGLHRKPVFILNTDGFWDAFLQFCQASQKAGFISMEHLQYLRPVYSQEEIFNFFKK